MTVLKASDLGFHLGTETEDEPLDVLDLPQLYTRPTAETLLSTLADLTSEPQSWDVTPRNGTPRATSGASTPFKQKRKVRNEGVPQYLTRIIASPLAWITDDAEKEQIWESAAQRLSERSGRTAMGTISRDFDIPITVSEAEPTTLPVVEESSVSEDSIKVTLYEPALTADNLGLKTWASSYLLARRLCQIKDSLLPALQQSSVLELGAGTGLVGISAAAVFGRRVVLTDLPEILPNLERNADANMRTISERGGEINTFVLDWSRPEAFAIDGALPARAHAFSLILVADPIYSPQHPELLVRAIEYHLAETRQARVIIELPLREAFVAEREDLRSRLYSIGLEIIEQGEETGFDDWTKGTHDDELAEVRCWWSVWARR